MRGRRWLVGLCAVLAVGVLDAGAASAQSGTTFDPSTAADGPLAGFTAFGGGFAVGVDSGAVADRFVVVDGSDYASWWHAYTLNDTPFPTVGDRTMTMTVDLTDGEAGLYFNAESDASNWLRFSAQGSGFYNVEYPGGSWFSGTATVADPTSVVLAVDLTDSDHPSMKLDGVELAGGRTCTPSCDGMYWGVFLDGPAKVRMLGISGGGGTVDPDPPSGTVVIVLDPELATFVTVVSGIVVFMLAALVVMGMANRD